MLPTPVFSEVDPGPRLGIDERLCRTCPGCPQGKPFRGSIVRVDRRVFIALKLKSACPSSVPCHPLLVLVLVRASDLLTAFRSRFQRITDPRPGAATSKSARFR